MQSSRQIFIAIVLFVACAIVIPGSIVLQGSSRILNPPPSTPPSTQCKATYGWVLFFLLSFCLATLATIFVAVTKYANQGPDFESYNADPSFHPITIQDVTSTGEAGEAPVQTFRREHLPRALREDKVVQGLGASIALVLGCLFIWGVEILAQDSCEDHNALNLYFKFLFWSFVVIIPPCVVCGGIGHFFLNNESKSMPAGDQQFQSLQQNLNGNEVAGQSTDGTSAVDPASGDIIRVVPGTNIAIVRDPEIAEL